MPRTKVKKIPLIEETISQPEEGEYIFDIPQNEVEVQDAPLWRRTVAYLIDLIFFYFLFFQIFMFIYLPKVGLNFDNFSEMQAYLNSSIDAQIRLIVGFISALFIFLFYFMLMEKNLKTTIGKKIMGLQLMGKEIGYGRLFARNITKTVLIFLLPLDMIGFVFYKTQRFTEKITNTKVIYYPRLSLTYEV